MIERRVQPRKVPSCIAVAAPWAMWFVIERTASLAAGEDIRAQDPAYWFSWRRNRRNSPAIAVARVGVNVTVLEATAELDEMGAGIKTTRNIGRLLLALGIDQIIGYNRVQFEELNLCRKDGTKVDWVQNWLEVYMSGQRWDE
ncbi:hypothetical protein K432DRAFT_404412 [Lepidopterella palustris CBS 459.81]|uniref:Uncharacterized protein n=1 Tax=Lepidopterella palustris CBS 459.81 TaxID=1314670 RepID=A0A8E2EB60_9PEZI|nr:hypothetical protein K432DRAFT_404412 [Lepidopterella palustris CBS 459.81]